MLLGRVSPLLNEEGLSIDWTGLHVLLAQCDLNPMVSI
jgi:hypothetical protein